MIHTTRPNMHMRMDLCGFPQGTFSESDPLNNAPVEKVSNFSLDYLYGSFPEGESPKVLQSISWCLSYDAISFMVPNPMMQSVSWESSMFNTSGSALQHSLDSLRWGYELFLLSYIFTGEKWQRKVCTIYREVITN